MVGWRAFVETARNVNIVPLCLPPESVPGQPLSANLTCRSTYLNWRNTIEIKWSTPLEAVHKQPNSDGLVARMKRLLTSAARTKQQCIALLAMKPKCRSHSDMKRSTTSQFNDNLIIVNGRDGTQNIKHCVQWKGPVSNPHWMGYEPISESQRVGSN